MRNFFLSTLIFISTNLFADNHRCEDRGNDPEVCDLFDEVSDAFQEEIFEVLVVGTVLIGVVAIAAYNARQSKGIGSEYIYFDKNSNSIIFSENTGLENLEINFSNQISQDPFQTRNLHSSDYLYVGLKFRF